jgi:uncharacterized protein YkwD
MAATTGLAQASQAGAPEPPSPRAKVPQRLIAPPATCPDQGSAARFLERQMLCLTNFARAAAGRPPLLADAGLHQAAGHKDGDILSCDEFSHEACGRDFAFWVERFSDCHAIGENIAWGTGSLGRVRAIFRAWMHSSGHRENILGPYSRIGIAVRVGSLEGNAGARVWAQDFGGSC